MKYKNTLLGIINICNLTYFLSEFYPVTPLCLSLVLLTETETGKDCSISRDDGIVLLSVHILLAVDRHMIPLRG